MRGLVAAWMLCRSLWRSPVLSSRERHRWDPEETGEAIVAEIKKILEPQEALGYVQVLARAGVSGTFGRCPEMRHSIAVVGICKLAVSRFILLCPKPIILKRIFVQFPIDFRYVWQVHADLPVMLSCKGNLLRGSPAFSDSSNPSKF